MYFNPRTREGCDINDGGELQDPLNISIHAPVKGATKTPDSAKMLAMAFQSTHP